jgi:GT2 family glycosyltransferase
VSTVSLATLGRLGVTQSRGDEPRAVDWVMGAAVMLRREALDEVGLFDESFFLYSEEVDLQARLHRAGWEVHYFPRVSVVHHESQFSAEIPERRINEMWRSRHRYWRKHHSGAGARIAALATGAQYVVRGALSPIVRRDPGVGARMRLHARDSWRVTGPGLRELADEWNGRVGPAPQR